MRLLRHTLVYIISLFYELQLNQWEDYTLSVNAETATQAMPPQSLKRLQSGIEQRYRSALMTRVDTYH